MKKMKTDKSIKEYFDLKNFKIPNYQRGYKWGVPKDGECAVSVLMDCLIDAKDNPTDYYVQGITACEEDGVIILIDGQQRTTTFYLLLKYLNYDKLPEIEYEIREDSDNFLKNSEINLGLIKYSGNDPIDDDSQDIFYFKKSIKTIHSKLEKIEKEKFKIFVLDKVKLFFIEINPKDATKVFSMMNGQKAIMKADELVKSALLSKASRNLLSKENTIAEEWEINSLRNKYAREWDKWLYWWNKPEVKSFYGSGNNPLGLLLEYFYYSKNIENAKNEYNYKHFNEEFFRNNTSAKQNFKEIRILQKTFEDWFNDYESYNYLGIILKTGANKKDALLYFLKNNSIEIIKEYAKWSIVGATHREIIPNSDEFNENTKEEKAIKVIENLNLKIIYGIHNDLALKQLLRRNVELDCELNRKFDFKLYGEKSLEHIYPKSRILDLAFEENSNYSVHSIGNLVLLDKNTNSSFNDALPEDKTNKYFDLENVRWSLKLLHTVSVFTKKEWREDSIINNQEEFLKEIKNYYN
jgi:hypothetical protein